MALLSMMWTLAYAHFVLRLFRPWRHGRGDHIAVALDLHAGLALPVSMSTKGEGRTVCKFHIVISRFPFSHWQWLPLHFTLVLACFWNACSNYGFRSSLWQQQAQELRERSRRWELVTTRKQTDSFQVTAVQQV